MTSQKLQTTKSENLQKAEELILSLAASPAKPLVLPEKDKVLMTLEVLSSLKLQDLLKLSSLGILSVRTSKDFSRMTAGELSEQSSVQWQNWGIASNGKFLTARITACPKTWNASSLLDILETEVEEKYFLSSQQTEKILAECRN